MTKNSAPLPPKKNTKGVKDEKWRDFCGGFLIAMTNKIELSSD